MLTPGGVEYVTSDAVFIPHNMGVVILGEPGVGKSSSIAALGPISKELGIDGIRPFFIPGSKGLEALQIDQPIKQCPTCKGEGCASCALSPGPGKIRAIPETYEGALIWVKWAVEQRFNPIVFDTLPDFFDLCMDSVMKAEGVKDMGDIAHGQGWKKARRKLSEILTFITRNNCGIYMVCHLEVKTLRVGSTEIQKHVMDLTTQARNEINAIADFIIMFTIERDAKGEPVWMARVDPSPEYGTKNRPTLDANKILPPSFDRGKSPEEFARTFLRFFYPSKEKP